MEYELLDNGYTRLKVPKKQFKVYEELIKSYIIFFGGKCIKESSRFIYYVIYADLISKEE